MLTMYFIVMAQVNIQDGGYQPVYRTAVVGYMPDGRHLSSV